MMICMNFKLKIVSFECHPSRTFLIVLDFFALKCLRNMKAQIQDSCEEHIISFANKDVSSSVAIWRKLSELTLPLIEARVEQIEKSMSRFEVQRT